MGIGKDTTSLKMIRGTQKLPGLPPFAFVFAWLLRTSLDDLIFSSSAKEVW